MPLKRDWQAKPGKRERKRGREPVTISPRITESGLSLLFFRGQGKEWKITEI